MNFKTVDETEERIRWVLIERQDRSMMPSKATGTTGTTDSQIRSFHWLHYPHLNLKLLLGIRVVKEKRWKLLSRHSKGYNGRSMSRQIQLLFQISSRRDSASLLKIVAIARVSSTARLYLTSVPMAVSSMWQHSPSFSCLDRFEPPSRTFDLECLPYG